MWTKSIKKPTVVHQIQGRFMHAMNNLSYRNDSNVIVLGGPVSPARQLDAQVEEANIPWNKMEFSKWMDENVIGKYKVGELVCRKYLPIIPDNHPMQYWRISYINELHQTARWHNVHKQPVVLHCENGRKEWDYFCPAAVRKLTVSEANHVYASNT